MKLANVRVLILNIREWRELPIWTVSEWMESVVDRGDFIKLVMEETTPALPKARGREVPFPFGVHFNNDLNLHTSHDGAPPLGGLIAHS